MQKAVPQQFRLGYTVTSYLKHSHVYGLCNDVVTLIAEHGNVCVVEDKNGKRFPALTEMLQPYIQEADESIPAPLPAPAVAQTKPPAVKKTKKVIINHQNELF